MQPSELPVEYSPYNMLLLNRLLGLLGWVAVKQGDQFFAYVKDGDVYTQRLSASTWREFMALLNAQFQINLSVRAGTIQKRPPQSIRKTNDAHRKTDNR